MKAMVLCAGHGTRLGDLTREMPKPMLPLQGRPMLEYHLAHLAGHGFDQIAINLHFMPEIIRNYFGDGSKFNVALTYSEEPQLLGTAGGVKKMEVVFRGEESFLIQYGDILTDQDLTALLDFHRAKKALATLLVHERANSNSVVTLDEAQRITGFLERPGEKEREGVKSSWVSSSILICQPAVLDLIPANTASDFPRDIFPKLIATGRMFGFPLTGYRCAVDSPERLAEAKAAIAEGRCRIKLPPIAIAAPQT